MTTQTNTSGAKNLPEAKFSAGGIFATVWKNTASNKEGKEIEYSTISIERRYKDRNDEWKSTNSMRQTDLPKAVVVLQKAYEHLVLKGQSNTGEIA
ncbi:hypothetical protein GF345_02530 [Candidatus Woesearchaeota archaeon]|nr:hypothetical protein [Candidatus Woesearchaeota archaeon]